MVFVIFWQNFRKLNFSAFDTSKLDEYAKKAKEQWGDTPAYKEYAEKSKNWTKEYESGLMADFTKLFEEFGTMKGMDPASEEVQAQVKKVQDFITEHMYTCTDDILYKQEYLPTVLWPFLRIHQAYLYQMLKNSISSLLSL